MTHRVQYGNRLAPSTADENVPKILRLFKGKNVVSMKDMQKATGKKWVRGFLNALSKTVEPVVPVKDGRTVLGYRLESKPLVMNSTGTSFRGPDGRFVPVAAAKPKKTATASKKKGAAKKTASSEVTEANVTQALADPAPEITATETVTATPVANVAADEVVRPAPVVPVTSNEDKMDIPAFLRKS